MPTDSAALYRFYQPLHGSVGISVHHGYGIYHHTVIGSVPVLMYRFTFLKITYVSLL